MWSPITNPLPKTKYSKKLVEFVCNCKQKTRRVMPWKNYASGISTSCGRCSYINLDELLNTKFGYLKICDTNDLTKPYSSNKKVKFICDCGTEKLIVLKSVINKLTKSCGCLLRNKSPKFSDHALNYKGSLKLLKPKSSNVKIMDDNWWTTQQFGRLRVSPNQGAQGKSSDKKLVCECECGNTNKVRAAHLTLGKIKSCGKCSIKAHRWWNNHVMNQYPTNLIDFKKSLNGSYLEPITFSKKKPKVKCLFCNNIFTPNFYDIYLKQIKSCGCLSSKITSPNIEIGNYIESLGLSCKYEHQIEGYAVDVYITELNIAIDYHGLRYHSEKYKKSKKTDLDKYQKLSPLCDYIIIFGDEWTFKKHIIKSLIKEKCNKSNPIYIRPQKCIINLITYDSIKDLYEKHHYIGPRSSKWHIGVYFNDELIAGMSVSTPSRRSSYNYEITRMARNPKYAVYGLWSYILTKFKDFGICGKIVSYSDNRLSSGNVYKRMGFVLDGEVKPNYYYTNHQRRWDKSSHRKSKTEKLLAITESKLRAESGLWKIWDYGKKRWVINMV